MNVNEIYGLAFTVVFNVGPLIQLRKIVVNKSSVNISLVMWILQAIGQVCVLSYYYNLNVHGIFNYVNSIIGLILNMCMVVCIYVYRNKR
jgi:uncharacterized protein with PQ loop repeat